MNFKKQHLFSYLAPLTSFMLIALFCMGSLVSVFFYNTTPKGQTLLLVLGALLFFLRLGEIIKFDRTIIIQKPFFLFLLFVIVVSINLIIQKSQGYDLTGIDDRSSYLATLEVFAMGLVWFFCGSSIQFLKIDKSNMRSGLIIMLVFSLIFHALNGGLVVSYININSNNFNENLISHLTTGDNVVILLLIAYGFAQQRMKLLIAPFIILILFSLGGRNALLTTVMAMLIFHISRRERNHILVILSPFLMAIGLLGVFYNSDLVNDELVSRMLFTEGLSSDASFIQRNQQIYEAAINLVAQAPIGNASLIVRQQGLFGGYSHNILSVWQLFGLVPLIILLFITLNATRYMWVRLKEIASPLDEFASILLIYSVLCIFISRAIGFPCFWLAMGYWVVRSAKPGKLSKNRFS